MRTLKGLLIAVLALGINTGFTTTAYANPQETDHAIGQEFEIDKLSDEAQSEVKKIIDEYCTTGNLDEYAEYSANFLERLSNSDRRVVGVTIFGGVGVAMTSWSILRNTWVLFKNTVVGTTGVIIAGGSNYLINRMEQGETEANFRLQEQISALGKFFGIDFGIDTNNKKRNLSEKELMSVCKKNLQ